jgi:hypothetical protein
MRLRSYDQLYKAVTHIIRISLFPCIDATDGVTIRKGRIMCVYRLQYREKTERERLDLYTENTREIFDVFATLSHSEARHSCCYISSGGKLLRVASDSRVAEHQSFLS